MSLDFMFTSDSDTDGHPDTLCDQISDAVVDSFLKRDRFSRVITECAVSTAIVFIAARFTSEASVDVTRVAREVINGIGYDHHSFNSKTCSIVTSLREMPNGEIPDVDENNLSEEAIAKLMVKNQA